MSGFVKLMRGESIEVMLAKGYHSEFVLMTIIALRAKREASKIENLEAGQAFVGDYQSVNLTRQKYRTALKNLETWGFITTKPTNKGTIVTVANTCVYDINEKENNQQPNQQLTNSQPTANQQLTTNKKLRSKEVKNKPTPQAPQGGWKYSSFETPGWINRELWLEFLSTRPAKTNTELALKRLQAKLEKLSAKDSAAASEIIEQSIENGWQGVFKISGGGYQGGQKQLTPARWAAPGESRDQIIYVGRMYAQDGVPAAVEWLKENGLSMYGDH